MKFLMLLKLDKWFAATGGLNIGQFYFFQSTGPLGDPGGSPGTGWEDLLKNAFLG